MTECLLRIDGVEIAVRDVEITHEPPSLRHPGGEHHMIIDAYDCLIATENIEPLVDTLTLDAHAQNH